MNKKASGYIFPLLVSYLALSSNVEAKNIEHRHLLRGDDFINFGNKVVDDKSLIFANQRQKKAYVALQAWKKAIYSDPKNITSGWVGPDVCSYRGVFCDRALDDPESRVVAGIDLNHGDIAGHLPLEIGLLTDVALIHLNSNRFCGAIPKTISKLKLLFEIDLSNNLFVGPFPDVVVGLPSLKYLDLRFNNFEGKLPPGLFDKGLDAVFLNDNRLEGNLPENFGNSTASVLVLANNEFTGCLPRSIGRMGKSLEELLLLGNVFSGCMPEEITRLRHLTVLDVKRNKLVGELPAGLEYMPSLEVMGLDDNRFSGRVPGDLCTLPNLKNLSFSDNYFQSEDRSCVPPREGAAELGNRGNCLAGVENQRTGKKCQQVLSKPVDCSKTGCRAGPQGTGPGGSERSTTPKALGPFKPKRIPHSPPPVAPPPPPPPPPHVSSPPPPAFPDVVLPPDLGSVYASPPPPIFHGY